MNKKAEFRDFIKSRPELIDYVTSNKMSWQQFYEIYDLYGPDDNVWKKYSKIPEVETDNFSNVSKLSDLIKNVNMDSIQEHIGTAQKALGFVSELAGSGKSNVPTPKGPTTPRPINKFFGD